MSLNEKERKWDTECRKESKRYGRMLIISLIAIAVLMILVYAQIIPETIATALIFVFITFTIIAYIPWLHFSSGLSSGIYYSKIGHNPLRGDKKIYAIIEGTKMRLWDGSVTATVNLPKGIKKIREYISQQILLPAHGNLLNLPSNHKLSNMLERIKIVSKNTALPRGDIGLVLGYGKDTTTAQVSSFDEGISPPLEFSNEVSKKTDEQIKLAIARMLLAVNGDIPLLEKLNADSFMGEYWMAS